MKNREFEVLETEECPLCRGTGMFENDEGYPDTCPECNGKGKVPKTPVEEKKKAWF